MKVVERIFLYTVLAILVFYVFLVDGNVESQEYKLGQYITARSIDIVDDEGKPCIALFSGKNGGNISIINKDFKFVVNMSVTKEGNGVINIVNKEGGSGSSILLIADEDSGSMIVKNKNNKDIATIGIDSKEGGGEIVTCNKDGIPKTFIISVDNGGRVFIFNKDGTVGTAMTTTDEGGKIETYNKDGVMGTAMTTTDEGGVIVTGNKDVIGTVIATDKKNGSVATYNKNDCPLVLISQTEEGHGGIWVNDRYGEYPAFYGHKR